MADKIATSTGSPPDGPREPPPGSPPRGTGGGGSGAAGSSRRVGGGFRPLVAIALTGFLVWLVWRVLVAFAGVRPPEADPLDPPSFPAAAWWLTPIERNAFMRLPVIDGDLEAVAIATGTGRLVAVGAGGLVVLSDDGGVSWRAAEVAWPTPGRDTYPLPDPNPDIRQQTAPSAPPAGPEQKGAEPRAFLAPLMRAARAADAASEAEPKKGAGVVDGGGTAGDAGSATAAGGGGSAGGSDSGGSGGTGGGFEAGDNGGTAGGFGGALGGTSGTEAGSEAAGGSSGGGLGASPGGNETTGSASGGDEAPRPAPVRQRLLDVAFAADGQRVVAVGAGPVVLRSDDGGETWRAGPGAGVVDAGGIDAGGSAFRGVTIDPGGVATIVGDRGAMAAVLPGGPVLPMDAGISANLRAISNDGNASAARMVAVGDGGVVVYASDDAKGGPAVSEITDSDLFDVLHLDAGRVLTVGDGGAIFVSENGGVDWSTRDSGSTASLHGIALGADGAVVVTGANGTVLRSEDRGETWLASRTPSAATLRGVVVGAGGAGVAVGDAGTVLAGKLPGGAWLTRAASERSMLRGVAFDGEGRALAVGGDGALFLSDDGGGTWSMRGHGLGDGFNDVARVGPGRLVAVGDDGTVGVFSARFDGAAPIEQVAPGALLAVTGAGEGDAIAVGDGGLVVVSRDGGGTFEQRPSGSEAALHGVTARADGTVLAVGDGGVVLRSADRGESWSPPLIATGADLRAVAFTGDGAGLVAVGVRGAALVSRDGGASWRPVASGVETTLHALELLPRGRLLAVGAGGVALVSADGGASWSPVESGTVATLMDAAVDGLGGVIAVGHGRIVRSLDAGSSFVPVEHVRWPAPWGYAAALLAAWLTYAYARSRSQPTAQAAAEASIAGLAASDRPLRAGDRDPLDFGEVAEGLSLFLRNAGTDPPLTLGITGEWGTGKSSLMRLLHADLSGRGFRPVWFNAWHHQKGEQLMASLFAHIRAQGVPPLFSRLGLRYRALLLWRRGRDRWVRYGLMAAAFTFAVLYGVKNGDAAGRLLDGLGSAYQDDGWVGSVSVLFGAIGLKGAGVIAAIVVPLLAALRALRAFGMSPAALMTGVTGAARGGEQRERPGARYTFAREFAEVTSALRPYTMVIFIDDLDRCAKEVVPEMLETVNFLMTSGDCFVVLGMARGWVETCVGLAFKELAEEMDDGAEDGTEPREESPGDGKRLRRDFARDYLEKLLNVEVPVPVASERGTLALLAPDEPVAQRRDEHRLRDAIGEALPALGLAAVVGVGAVLGWYLPAVHVAPKPAEIRAEVGRLTIHTPASDPFTPGSGLEIPVVRRRAPGNEAGAAVVLGQVAFEGARGDLAIEFGAGVAGGAEQQVQGVIPAESAGIGAEPGSRRISLGTLAGEPADAELVLRLAGPVAAPGAASAVAGGEVDAAPPNVQSGDGSRGEEPASLEPGRAPWHAADWLLAGMTALGVLLIGWLTVTPRGVVERDSPTFLAALRLWHPWIVLRRNTPRAVKRYLNLVRYVAMRSRSGGADGRTLPEPVAVALAALDGLSVEAPWVRSASRFARLERGEYADLLDESFASESDAVRGHAAERLRGIIAAHRAHERFDAAERDLFDAAYRERYVEVMGDVRED